MFFSLKDMFIIRELSALPSCAVVANGRCVLENVFMPVILGKG